MSKFLKLIILFVICTIPIGALYYYSSTAEKLPSENKRVLIAILARNKEHVLPTFLRNLENLNYDKRLISIYINTNNNEDKTEELLLSWINKNRADYRQIIYENHEVDNLGSSLPHEWTIKRFHVLGEIRNKSLQLTKELNCDYYFVIDVDNFILPETLKYLVNKDKPIIAPMLKSIPEKVDYYSTFFCAVDPIGYYNCHPDHEKIVDRKIIGTFQVPLVHCTYLVNANYIDKLTYQDGTDHHEFVIFARSARDNNIDMFVCNEIVFGTLLHFHRDLTLKEEAEIMSALPAMNYPGI